MPIVSLTATSKTPRSTQARRHVRDLLPAATAPSNGQPNAVER